MPISPLSTLFPPHRTQIITPGRPSNTSSFETTSKSRSLSRSDIDNRVIPSASSDGLMNSFGLLTTPASNILSAASRINCREDGAGRHITRLLRRSSPVNPVNAHYVIQINSNHVLESFIVALILSRTVNRAFMSTPDESTTSRRTSFAIREFSCFGDKASSSSRKCLICPTAS